MGGGAGAESELPAPQWYRSQQRHRRSAIEPPHTKNKPVRRGGNKMTVKTDKAGLSLGDADKARHKISMGWDGSGVWGFYMQAALGWRWVGEFSPTATLSPIELRMMRLAPKLTLYGKRPVCLPHTVQLVHN